MRYEISLCDMELHRVMLFIRVNYVDPLSPGQIMVLLLFPAPDDDVIFFMLDPVDSGIEMLANMRAHIWKQMDI